MKGISVYSKQKKQKQQGKHFPPVSSRKKMLFRASALTMRPNFKAEIGMASVLLPFLHDRGTASTRERDKESDERERKERGHWTRTGVSRRGRRARWPESASATTAARGCCREPLPPAGASPEAAPPRRRRPPRTAPSWEPLDPSLPRLLSYGGASGLLVPPALLGSRSLPRRRGGRRKSRGAQQPARSSLVASGYCCR